MIPAWLGNRLWQLCCLPEAYRFQHGKLKATQEQILRQLLKRQSQTPFGRRHGLQNIATYQAFQRQVPVSSYEQLLPYLNGGLSQQPIRIWEPTGGSTGGSKWIPWTSHLQAEFRRAVAVWMWHLFRRHPKIRDGRSYWQLTPKTEIAKPAWLEGQSTGFEADADYLGPLGRYLERSVLLSVPQGPDLWRRTVSTLRDAQDLRLISCWSPSFLTCLQAQFLEHAHAWEPQKWWPDLQVISCWTSAASASYLGKIQQLFPGVDIQPKGLLATEGVTSIPVGERHPLAYRSHFFEFSDESQTFPAWELEQGQELRVILSNGSGMTRYDTGDRVRVTGRLKDIPCLEFLGRDGVVDHRGEKLSLHHVESALSQVDGFAMLTYEDNGYVLFLGQATSRRISPDNPQPDQPIQAKIHQVQDELQQSYSYQDCLQLGQLQPLRGFLVKGDPWQQYERICSQHFGQSEGSVKPVAYHPSHLWSQHFRGSFIAAKKP